MENVNFILVFLEGILSFFSPCVLPLIPVYMGYLAGNTKKVNEETGEIIYPRKTVFINTILFILGISFAFFLLGMSFSALGSFFESNKEIIMRISGGIIIILGLIQLGIFKIAFFQKEHRIKTKINLQKMNPIIAFVLGFTFSFAWTPCIGPTLASVLLLASSNANVWAGNLLVLVYTLGFVIPFLLLGIFTTAVLNFIKRKQTLFQYVIKIAAVVLILMGILALTGGINGINKFFSTLGNTEENNTNNEVIENVTKEESKKEENQIQEPEEKREEQSEQDFILKDQYGNTHQLSDYKGKVVFLNFWTTWCTYCKKEMPEIQKLYEEYGKNEKDVIILGVANPASKMYPKGADVSQEEIESFLKKGGYTYPVVFDKTGKVFGKYGVEAFPTSFMIDKEGELHTYVQGALPEGKLKDFIENTRKK